MYNGLDLINTSDASEFNVDLADFRRLSCLLDELKAREVSEFNFGGMSVRLVSNDCVPDGEIWLIQR